MADGFRAVATDQLNVPSTSWIRATTCGINSFSTLMSINTNNLCFQSTILGIE
jgi:hypothetical protein